MKVNVGLTTPLIQTSHYKTGFIIATAVAEANEIAAFDGPPGTGKTTTVRQVANSLDRPFVIATLPHNPNPHDLLRYIHAGVTGREPGRRARYDLQNETLEALADWGGVLVVDEIQNSKEKALQELVWLYEQSEHAFGLVVVGSGVLETVKQHPQLATRIMGAWKFRPLSGEELVDSVRAMDPLFEQSTTRDLLRHDRLSCSGNLRAWVRTLKWAKRMNLEGPITREQFAAIADLLVTFNMEDE